MTDYSYISHTHLKLKRALGANDDVLVVTLLGVVRQLKRELGAQHPPTEKLGPQHLKHQPNGSVHPEDQEPKALKKKTGADLPKGTQAGST